MHLQLVAAGGCWLSACDTSNALVGGWELCILKQASHGAALKRSVEVTSRTLPLPETPKADVNACLDWGTPFPPPGWIVLALKICVKL